MLAAKLVKLGAKVMALSDELTAELKRETSRFFRNRASWTASTAAADKDRVSFHEFDAWLDGGPANDGEMLGAGFPPVAKLGLLPTVVAEPKGVAVSISI
jgi:hypothetical protein